MVRKVKDGHLPLSYGTDYRKILTNGENRLSRCVRNHGKKTVGIQLADEVLCFTHDDSAATNSTGTETPDSPQPVPATPLFHLSYVNRYEDTQTPDFPQAVSVTPLLHFSYANRDENTQPGPNPGQIAKKPKKPRWSRLFGRK
jgi:hypothetical protein